jgi:type VII secretion-associated serine protease mycosin
VVAPTALLAVVLTTGTTLAVPAPAEARAAECARPGEVIAEVPWAQRLLAPDRAWSFTQGSGVTVAVLGSGVDAQHPQLRGRVLRGYDAVTRRAGADTDCLGLGTQVAGIIAARPTRSVGFAGVAPAVTVLPVRVITDSFGQVEPAVLARGITWAVDNGARVIDVPLAIYTDESAVRTAVARAVARGVVVVAAVGDQGGRQAVDPTSYPAAYPDVVGVGAVDPSGTLWTNSQVGPYVDVVAPGAQVTTLQRVRGLVARVTGTGIASAFVSATAALVWDRRGSDATASMVARIVEDTAAPAPERVGSQRYGNGVVDPFAAVTALSDAGRPGGETPPTLQRPQPQTDPVGERTRDMALMAGAAAIFLTLAVFALALIMPRGRRRFWRATLAAPPPAAPEQPDLGPPVGLFDDRPAMPGR